jgi:hypothetical protein
MNVNEVKSITDRERNGIRNYKNENGEKLDRSENWIRIKQSRQQRSWQNGDLGMDRLGMPCCSIVDGLANSSKPGYPNEIEEELVLNKENQIDMDSVELK